MNRIIILTLLCAQLYNSSYASYLNQPSNMVLYAAAQENKDNMGILKKRFDYIAKSADLFASTEFLNLFFALKDSLKGEDLKKMKEQFQNYYEKPLYLDELNTLIEGWAKQIDDKEQLARKVKNEYEKRYKRFCERATKLHLNNEAVEFAIKEYGKESGVAKLFDYVLNNVEKADYKLGATNFVIYKDVPVFLRHHGPTGDGLPFPTEASSVFTPWLSAIFYMVKDVDYNTGEIGGKYVKTYTQLCYDILQSQDKLAQAKAIWENSYNGNFRDYLAKTCIMTMRSNKMVASKDKAAACLKIRIEERKNANISNKSAELEDICDIVFDNSLKSLILPTTHVHICYDLYEYYKDKVDAENKINIIDQCLIAFDEIQKGNIQWDYSKESPLDMLKKKKSIIVEEAGKDSDIYNEFIMNDVVARFGEYSEEYDAIVND